MNTFSVQETIADTVYPMSDFRNWILNILSGFDLHLTPGTFLYTIVMLGIALGISVLFVLLVKFIFTGLFTKLLLRFSWFQRHEEKTRMQIRRLIRIVGISIFMGLLPMVWPMESTWKTLLLKVGNVWLAVIIAKIIGSIFEMSRSNMLANEKYRNSPFLNLFQVFAGIVYFITGVVIVSIIFGLQIKTILGSVAALSAVTMLVLQDPILGLVASVALSSNDMVRVGDWIDIGGGNEGTVLDISLVTVKIRAFDNTTFTVAPYDLLRKSFTNWRSVDEAQARRAKQSLFIDMQSIKYADDKMLERLKNSPELHDYITAAVEEIEKDNAKQGRTDSYSRRGLTNIGIFRRYVIEYLKSLDTVNANYTCTARLRQPTDLGLPLELYFFTKATGFVDHNAAVSDVFDHLFAVINVFELRVFQSVNGNNITSILNQDDTDAKLFFEE